MCSNNILNFQEFTTILNACTKKSGNLLNAPRIYVHIHTYLCIYIHTYTYTQRYIYRHMHTHIYMHTYAYTYQPIDIMVRVFTSSLGDQGWVIPKTQKMVLDASLLNTQYYEAQIKSKWSNSGKVITPSPTPKCSSYWIRNLQVAFDYSQLNIYIHTHIRTQYIYIYNVSGYSRCYWYYVTQYYLFHSLVIND